MALLYAEHEQHPPRDVISMKGSLGEVVGRNVSPTEIPTPHTLTKDAEADSVEEREIMVKRNRNISMSGYEGDTEGISKPAWRQPSRGEATTPGRQV
ncbi:hypothetical protein DACRYDRAFT_21210 [Dacryopinax primogenitus]|uniref:Uncharacterized protein n=1 Tax=Dacryopinax primogenitus (strain DJM 731) TaxID=1858805 RepID=M5G0H0_DACPD|nr:uncharacterized protein DACRYDRAFT_21210 [Dacryopinax primogenitus]EJU03741.1 hypothetical protein DACRYDRAFT_21210 [Dacryopinax primogenitus]